MKWLIILTILLLVGCTETIYIEKNITIEVEKIVTPDCPTCSECTVCEVSNVTCEVCKNCTPCDNQKYITRLIREAKKCEKSEYYTNLSFCIDDINRSNSNLKDCSLRLCRYNNSWCNR